MIPKREDFRTIKDWRKALLLIDKGVCSTCDKILDKIAFNTRHKETKELSYQCKPCHRGHGLKARANRRKKETGAKHLKCWKHGRAHQKRLRDKKNGVYAVKAIFEGLLPNQVLLLWRTSALKSFPIIKAATITKPRIGDERDIWLTDLKRIQEIFQHDNFEHKIVCSENMDLSETGIDESKLDRYPDEIDKYVTKKGDLSPLRGWCFDKGYMIVTDDDPTHLPEAVIACDIPTVGVHFQHIGPAGFYEFCAMMLFWQVINDLDICGISQTGKPSNSTYERFYINAEGQRKKKKTYNQLHRIENPLNLNAWPHGILFNVHARWIFYVGVFEDTERSCQKTN